MAQPEPESELTRRTTSWKAGFRLPSVRTVNTILRRYNGKGFCGRVHPLLDLEHEALDDPHEFIRHRQAELILDCENRKIIRSDILLGGVRVPALLHFDENRSFSRIFRSSYASRTLSIASRLAENAIPTVDVLAALNRKGFPVEASLLITREMQNVRQLPATGRHQLEIHPPLELTDSLALQLGCCVAELHSRRLFHGDLKSRHILVEQTEPPRFIFVDLEKSAFWPLAPSSVRDVLAARDLVQLLSSIPERRNPKTATHRDILLESYLTKRKLPATRRRRLASWVDLYMGNDGFEQGKTLLENLLSRFTRRGADGSSPGQSPGSR